MLLQSYRIHGVGVRGRIVEFKETNLNVPRNHYIIPEEPSTLATPMGLSGFGRSLGMATQARC